MIPKILLVDDVGMFLELQKAYLKQSPVHVLTAKDGAEALSVVKKEHPSLVFMDLHMPNMDGAECCARLKGDAEFKSLPVVMITSEGKGAEREFCFRAGCDDFLTKPLDRVQFLAAARKYLPAIDRREIRIPFRAKVKVKVFGVTFSAEILDVSLNGVFIAADHELAAGTVLEVVFSMGGEGGPLVQAKGKVAWLNSSKGREKAKLPTGFGVEFSDLPEESREALRNFVGNHS